MEEKKKGKTLLCTFIVLFLLAVVAWTAYKAGREKQEEEVSGIQRQEMLRPLRQKIFF